MRSAIRLFSTLLLTASLSAPASGASWWERLLGSETSSSESADPKPEADRAAPTLDISSGLREALRVGSERVVEQLGRTDGFNLDPSIRIELPAGLQTARSLLDQVGMAGPLDDLEVRLNRAAEAATPRAKTLFLDAIRTMTIQDARALLQGGDTAATDYLRGRMEAPLTEDLRPAVDASLDSVGALQILDTVLERYDSIPFAPALDIDLRSYVTGKTVDGIFGRLAKEEQAIRADPAKRTTDLLRAVFGQG